MVRLHIIHAGSMRVFLEEMSKRYRQIRPEVEITLQGGGARWGAKQILAGAKADLFVSADRHSINDLLYPTYCERARSFASSEMVISYTERSKFQEELTADNWMDILLRPGVAYGHTDPELDPAGYRTLLVWQLAAHHYGRPDLYEQLQDTFSLENQLTNGPEIEKRLADGRLDYFFGYKSSAMHRGGKYMDLPVEINLGDPKYASLYSKARLTLSGAEEGTSVTLQGEPIFYSLAVCKGSEEKEEAIRLADFLCTQGQDVLPSLGFTVEEDVE